MIRNLLATTALVTIAAAGADAAEGQASERFLSTSTDAELASTIIGETVYTSSAEDAESVGEVNDLLVGNDGSIEAAIIGVGGFLGLGEKSVAVSYDELNLTTDEDGTYHVVLETSREELEAAPEFDVSTVAENRQGQAADQQDAMAPEGQAADQTAPVDQQSAMAPEGQGADQTVTADQQGAMAPEGQSADQSATADQQSAMAPEGQSGEQGAIAPTTNDQAADSGNMAAEDGMAATDQQSMAGEEATGRQDYEMVDVSTMGTDQLIGANVYSYNNENLGEIGEVVLTDNGETEALVIDVGGFLGIGEKPVAVAFEDLEFRADENGTLYVYTQFTEEQLEGATEYSEEEYQQNRDQMLLRSSG